MCMLWYCSIIYLHNTQHIVKICKAYLSKLYGEERMWTDRTKILLGQDGLDKLKSSSVAVIGIGGVGGYVCMMLARAGVENITLVDFDKVDETNINRQVVATSKTVGLEKTVVMKQMIEDINPKCVVKTYQNRFCNEFAQMFFTENKFDYVVDAIDKVTDKLDLICYCKQHEINIISAMGAGNRTNIPNFRVVDIFKTSNDGLAKIIRKKLREREVKSLDVVTCDTPAIKFDRTENPSVGSISYYPAMCGCVLGAFVINKLIEKQSSNE